MIKYYRDEFAYRGIAVFEEIDLDKSPNKNAPLILKDIDKAKLRDEYVDYDIEKLNPNYGASSDLLRYAILEEWGGVYVDSDVKPGKDSVSKIVEETNGLTPLQ